ncbi:MAG: DNA repair protein RadA [Oscillospiraceae bacterium]|nr:DNA repair protein RadA [Oscillospiraceae bacterium]
MKAKTVFFCSDCGYESPKWSGRCPSCGTWNTMTEAPTETKAKSGGVLASGRIPKSRPELLSALGSDDEIRFSTGFGEFDRVLGGGAVRGSLVLVGGAPGIGKSTLLLQFCGKLGKAERILYVTGEESKRQLKLRAERLDVSAESLFVLAETDLNEIIAAVGEIKPDVLIIDSVQTMYNPELTAAPGSVTQVKDCTMAVMQLAKGGNITAFIVGHVNKEGAIAGPKVLEHMVDCVLYFEGDRSMAYRVLRAEKNRFGSTNEIGVFEMGDSGLSEVKNPSEMLLSGRPLNSPGTCVTCVMEGTRPILAEIQALVAPSGFNSARRNSNGIDYNRATLLLAVIEKRGGIAVGGSDAYINVIGGLELSEPAADLATVLAIASSHSDKAIGGDLAAVGEVGLTGEIRSVDALNQRLVEIARLGFKRCVIPAHVRGDIKAPKGLELISVRNIREAIAAALS